MDDKENLIEQYRQALKNPGAPADLTRTNSIEDIYDIDLADGNIIIGSDIASSLSFNDTMSYPTVTISSGGAGGYIFNPNDFSTTTDWGDLTIGPTGPAKGKLRLTGDEADIEVNGVSLCDTIRDIQDRLNMLCPDPEMEQEWDDLREIREQYEAKLQECRDKSRMWKSLKDAP